MRLKPWLVMLLAVGCTDHPSGHPQITDPDSVGTPLPAAILEHVKGDGDWQPGVVGTALRERLKVRVTREGNAVPNVLVQWSADEPGSVFIPDHGISDAFGDVSTTYTVGSRAETQHVFASIPHDTLEYVIFAYAQADQYPTITRGDGVTSTPDVVLGVQVLNIWNEPVAGKLIHWAVLYQGNAVLDDTLSQTDATGEAITHLTLTSDPDTVNVYAGGSALFTVTLH
jgi:hypothetical protein